MVRTAFRKFIEMFPTDKEAMCAEIGVGHGYNSHSMLQAMPNMKLILIDQYKPYYSESESETTQELFDLCRQAMNEMRLPYSTQFIEMSSLEASKTFEDETFDFVYIDAEHTLEMVKQDIQVWLPKVKKGGMLSGHDYNLPDVQKAVKEVFPDADHDTFEDSTLKSDWWIIK